MSTLTTSMMPTSTSSAPPEASTSADAKRDDDGPTSRPLLFFVALGFGVVFTNLWIIVGVKYCFRYNQRARQAMLAEQNGDTIDMGNMQRPRRRREKKLMSMDEVNERFPLTKYKVWRASREQDGLPSTGGITAPPSRPGSIREQIVDLKRLPNEDGANVPNQPTSAVHGAGRVESSTDLRDFGAEGTSSTTPEVVRKSEEKVVVPQIRVDGPHGDRQSTNDSTNAHSTPTPLAPTTSAGSDITDEEDDPTRTAIPDPVLESTQPGDACAICIESLDEDDEVRGLTCGHAFHASCIDPWLTSRRACCPLCKADYYVPKTRTEGDSASAGTDGPNPIQHPPATLQRPRLFFGGLMLGGNGRLGWPAVVSQRPARVSRQQQRVAQEPQPPENGQETIPPTAGGVADADNNARDNATPEIVQTPRTTSRFASLIRTGQSRLPRFPRRGASRGDAPPAEAQMSTSNANTEAATTPGQLEANTR